MATNTKNYNLKKPDKTDYINVDDINKNMDLIDIAMNEVSTVALKRAEVVDNLTSTAGDVPLSAKQGRILKEMVETKIIQSNTAPIDHTVLWIDTANNGITKYYDVATTTWKPVVTETVWN